VYVERYSWIREYTYSGIDLDQDKPTIESASRFNIYPTDGAVPPLLNEPLSEDRQAILTELKRQLARGVGWDFPENMHEELYVFPAGLMLRANDELTRRSGIGRIWRH
jgi:hypothetical protein